MDSLSVCMVASRDGASVRAILAMLRPVADEIVLGVDSRRAEPVLSACADLVDRPYVLDFTGTAESHIAWLHLRCRGEWILRLDDDELPGAALLERLPELVRDRRHALQLLPRRNLFPTRERFIASHPWFPDYQPRLVRNVPGLWTFAGHPHSCIEVLGERRRVSDAPIYHLRYAASRAEERLETALERERLKPGLTTEGYEVNALAVPELWTGVETRAVPAADRAAIERVAAPAPATPLAVPPAPHISTHEAERLLTCREVTADAYAAEIEISAARTTLAAGTLAHLEVAVRNLGGVTWPPAHHDVPLIRLASRWLAADGETVIEPEGLRTAFEETVGPGERTRAMLAVRVPNASGRYVLEVDVVHELVRWFGCADRLAVSVEALDAPRAASGLARPEGWGAPERMLASPP
jgi:hypothetical protein